MTEPSAPGSPPGDARDAGSAYDLDRDAERVHERARLQPGERRAGSDDPEAQAELILEESDERTDDKGDASGAIVEHRSSAQTAHRE